MPPVRARRPTGGPRGLQRPILQHFLRIDDHGRTVRSRYERLPLRDPAEHLPGWQAVHGKPPECALHLPGCSSDLHGSARELLRVIDDRRNLRC